MSIFLSCTGAKGHSSVSKVVGVGERCPFSSVQSLEDVGAEVMILQAFSMDPTVRLAFQLC